MERSSSRSHPQPETGGKDSKDGLAAPAPPALHAVVRSRDGMGALSAIVQLFHRVGKELLLEGQRDMLVLRALSDAKTSFASVELQRGTFFQDYSFEQANQSSSNSIEEENPFLGKILLKSLGAVLRNVRKMKSFSICNEIANGVDHELVFEMMCEYGIRRTHRLAYQECVALSAVFDDLGASQLSVEIGVFKQLLEQVDHSSQIELVASRDVFIVRSFYQALNAAGPRHMSTEMSMPTREFLHYRYNSTEATEELVMSIRELKSMISFCESMEIPVFSVFFYGGGRPCKLSCEHSSFIVSLVVATLDPPGRASDNSVSQDIYGAPVMDDGELDRRYKQNEGNEDSTVRRLVPSVEESEPSSQSSATIGMGIAYSHQKAGGNIGAISDAVVNGARIGDFSNVVEIPGIGGEDSAHGGEEYAARMSTFSAYDESVVNKKRSREDGDSNKAGVPERCISGDSDFVAGPGKSAFSRSALKRLIDSDSEDDDFEILRNLS